MVFFCFTVDNILGSCPGSTKYRPASPASLFVSVHCLVLKTKSKKKLPAHCVLFLVYTRKVLHNAPRKDRTNDHAF